MKKLICLALAVFLLLFSVDCFASENSFQVVRHSVSLSQTSLSVFRGEAYRLTATIDSSITGGTILWSTSDSSVAEVTSSGLVVGHAAGTATITAALDIPAPGFSVNSATCTVTVSSSGLFVNSQYFLRSNQFLYLGLQNDSTTNGSYAAVRDLDTTEHGTWNLTIGTDGYYRIQSPYSSKYLRVKDDSNVSGTYLVQTTSTSSAGSKWVFMKTSRNYYVLLPKCALSVNKCLCSHNGTNNALLDIDTYINNANCCDEWRITRKMPTNGFEIEYEPEKWSSSTPRNQNCYLYALNCQDKPGTTGYWQGLSDPGVYSHTSISNFSTNPSVLWTATSNDFQLYSSELNQTLICQPIGKYDVCPVGSYKVALYVCLNGDHSSYHWYRQNPDGTWSSKVPTEIPTNKDDGGYVIVDPELCQISPLSIQYTLYGYYAISGWNLLHED